MNVMPGGNPEGPTPASTPSSTGPMSPDSRAVYPASAANKDAAGTGSYVGGSPIQRLGVGDMPQHRADPNLHLRSNTPADVNGPGLQRPLCQRCITYAATRNRHHDFQPRRRLEVPFGAKRLYRICN